MKATKRAAGKAAAAKRAACPEEQAFLELLRTTDQLSRRLAGLLKAEELSSNQYNVLRILRGAAERGKSAQGAAARGASKSKSKSGAELGQKAEGLACGEIGERMITRDPDITRLLDRLERRGLIARWRDERDRRVVMARITAEGLKLLSHMDLPVQQAHRRELGHLGQKRLGQLVELLKVARETQAVR